MVETLKEMGVHRKLAEHAGAEALEALMERWANAPIFEASADPAVAQQLAQITLCQTYLFGRFTLPSYAGHMYMTLRDLPPTEDDLGKVLQSNVGVFQGELYTNNIFQREGERHSHYIDMLEAYRAAGGDAYNVSLFEADVGLHGLHRATQKSDLWTPELETYAQTVEELTRDPLTTFMIALVSEDTIGEGYKTTLKHIAPGFEKFKTFMERHIFLDETEHGPATIDWMNFYFSCCRPDKEYVDQAVQNTQRFIEERLDTYRYKKSIVRTPVSQQ